MKDPITYATFVGDERKLLSAFAIYWSKMAAADINMYPICLTKGEWDEQYAAWRADLKMVEGETNATE